MARSHLQSLTGPLLGALLGLAGATAAADETLDEARALLERGNATAAYDLLAPLAEGREGDPEFDYVFGIAALDAGHATEAVFALERVLAVQPGNDLARAEIARAYFVLGERETARQEFAAVRDSEQAPEAARQTIDKYLALLERAAVEGEGTVVSGFVDLAFGYDTNVNSATDESQVALPILGNVQFQLNDNAQEIDSAYTHVGGAVNVSHPLNDRWRAVGGARGYSRQTESPFGTRDTYGYVGISGDFDRHRITVAGTAENFAVDNDTLRNVFGGFGQWTYTLDDTSRLNVSIQGSVLEYPNQPNRDADRYVGSAGYIKAFDRPGQPVVFVGAYGGVEDEQNDAFQQFGHDLYGGRVGGNVGVLPRTRLFATVAVEERDYHGPDAIFLTDRDDTQVNATVGLEYEFRRAWKVVPEITYVHNDSNIPLNDFERLVVGLRVRYTF